MNSFRLLTLSFMAGILLSPHSPNAYGQAETPMSKAWTILEAGVAQKRIGQRVSAVRVLGLIPDDPHAVDLAKNALKDSSALVRTAAATALGLMHASSAAPELKQTLLDKNLHVVLAAAHALFLINDPSCYDVYYAVLTGHRKNQEGMIAQEMAILKDPKQMAELGFSEGIGYVPFASMGWEALQTILQDRKNGDVAKAAIMAALATDPDVKSTDALVAATQHDNWILRVAALEALSKHGDPALLSKIEKSMDDPKDAVKWTGAAAVVHLSDLVQARGATKSTLHAEPTIQDDAKTNPAKSETDSTAH